MAAVRCLLSPGCAGPANLLNIGILLIRLRSTSIPNSSEVIPLVTDRERRVWSRGRVPRFRRTPTLVLALAIVLEPQTRRAGWPRRYGYWPHGGRSAT